MRQTQSKQVVPWCLAATCFVGLGLAIGCSGVEKMRGGGFSDSENWGQDLRDQRRDGARYGGVTTKANQIERNLGVR